MRICLVSVVTLVAAAAGRIDAFQATRYGPVSHPTAHSHRWQGAVPNQPLLISPNNRQHTHIAPKAVGYRSTGLRHAPVDGAHHSEALHGIAAILENPTLWSSLIMVSIVGLLYSWEEAIHNLRKKLPETLMPVLDSILGEVSGLGFVGLFLGTVVVNGPFGEAVEEVSEEFLGDGEILLETFEFLHDAFFQVGIAFFAVAGLTVFRVLQKLASLFEFRQKVFDTDKDGIVSLTELADFLDVDAVPVDMDGNGVLDDDEIRAAVRSVPRSPLWDELRMTSAQINAEALVVRERLLETCKVSSDFRIDLYFSNIFGKRLREIVELSPLTWLPLIPALAIANSIDVSRHVISAASSNAFESCGYFLGTPSNFVVSTAIAVLGWTWGCWNFWKMNEIKSMLMPVLVKDTEACCEATLLPPKYQDPELLESFNSSPGVFGWVESFFAEPATNEHEQLFGIAGAAGPKLYINSIKLQIWLVISQIVLWGTQVVGRDLSALVSQADNVGNPELLVPELIVFGTYVFISAAQLALAPQTFLKYCLVTSIEQMGDAEFFEVACTMAEDEAGLRLASNAEKNKIPNEELQPTL